MPTLEIKEKSLLKI